MDARHSLAPCCKCQGFAGGGTQAQSFADSKSSVEHSPALLNSGNALATNTNPEQSCRTSGQTFLQVPPLPDKRTLKQKEPHIGGEPAKPSVKTVTWSLRACTTRATCKRCYTARATRVIR